MNSNPPSSPVISVPESTPTRKQAPQDHSQNGTPANKASPSSANSRPNVSHRSRWGWLITVILLSGVSAAGWYYQEKWLPTLTAWLKGSGPPPRARPPIPVLTAAATKRNMDLYLNGLGTVTSLKTATIRSQVEGAIINVDFTEGEMVYKGRPLVEIDPRPFVIQRDQALAQVERDKAALEIANLNLTRLKNLLPKMVVNQQQVDEQIALVKQAEGAIKAGEALVANADLQLDYCKITAPIEGRIGLRLVDAGNIVRANDPNGLAVITQLEPIGLVFTIPQDDIPRVQKRMRAGRALTVEAYDRDFQTKLDSGKLTAIDNQVDAMTGTLKLKAEFENDDHILFPNQFVNTRMLVDTIENAIVVPSSAVQRGPDSTFVWFVKDDETVDKRDVIVGPSEGTETVIKSGLAVGEVVVTDGVDKLEAPSVDGAKPGSKVTIRGSTHRETKDSR